MSTNTEQKQLQNLCTRTDTLKKARQLLSTAKLKLPHVNAVCLPAVCAHIASKELDNNDVALKEAQMSSSVNKTEFNKTVKAVEGMLKTERPSRDSEPEARVTRSKAPSGIYSKLLKVCDTSVVSSEQLQQWLQRTENNITLSHNKALDDTMKTGIFLWVYNFVLDENPMTLDSFVRKHKLNSTHQETVRKSLQGKSLPKEIQRELARIKKGGSAAPTPSPQKTPSRPAKPTRVAPAKISPQKRKLETATEEEDEAEPEESPTRKIARTTRVPPTTPSRSPQKKPAQTNEDENADGEEETTPSKRPMRSTRIPPLSPKKKAVQSNEPAEGPTPSTSTEQTPAPDEGDSEEPRRSSRLSRRPVAANGTPSLPSLRSPTKRKAVETTEAEDVVRPASPSKKVRIQSPPRSPVASSSKITLETPTRKNAKPTPSSSASSSPTKRASTQTPKSSPQKRPSATTTPKSSPTKPARKKEVVAEDEEEPPKKPRFKRFRPVFEAFKQWNAQDPRVVKEEQRAKKIYDELVEKFGHPFEHLRPPLLVES